MTSIQIVEVGPRDGLQNEARTMPIEMRVKLIDLLSACGFSEIEVGSFVSPKWIPQLADTGKVLSQIQQNPSCLYSALVPNERGMVDAISAGLKNVSIFTAASETFNQKNINCSIDESFERFQPVIKMAECHGIRVRGYVSCAITCPYEGDIVPQAVADVAKRLAQLGVSEISLGDTIGKGTPASIRNMIEAVSDQVPIDKLAIHCHDTYGNATKNVLEALNLGIRVVDSAIHGLGGCPFAVVKPGEKAKGNVATETIAAALHGAGYSTGIDEKALRQASAFVAKWLAGE